MSEHKEINPFYLLSEWEVEPLIEIWKNHAGVESADIAFLKLRLNHNNQFATVAMTQRLQTDKAAAIKEGRRKTIYAVSIPTRNTESYHVNEGGSMEVVEGRAPHIRSYFDGSQVPYSHSIAISIDHEEQRILAKDPKGHDLKDAVKRLFLDVYPDHSITIDRRQQQSDRNNCYAYTLHNMFVMAGMDKFQETLDIARWNENIIDMLETYGIAMPPNMDKEAFAQANEKQYGVSHPTFNNRFL